MNNKNNRFIELFIVFLLVVLSGNLGVYDLLNIQLILSITAIFLILLYIYKKPIITLHFLVIAIIFTFIIIIQCLTFEFWPFDTIAGFFIRLFIGYAVVRLVLDFHILYIKVLTFIAIISLYLHIPTLLLTLMGIDLSPFIINIAEYLGIPVENKISFFVHSFMTDNFYRNAGMFWEPGAFQGYLILALILLILVKDEISKALFKRYFFILVVTILTTMSTAGYLALLLIPFIYKKWSYNGKVKLSNIVILSMIIPFIVFVFLIAYHKLPFIGDKIQEQMEMVEYREGRWELTRFGTLIFKWEYIQSRPFTGWGMREETRYLLHPEKIGRMQAVGNGFATFIAKYGLIGFLTWFVSVYIGFKQLSRGNTIQAILICLLLVVLLQSESFLNYPLFLGLAFIGLANDKSHNIDYRKKVFG